MALLLIGLFLLVIIMGREDKGRKRRCRVHVVEGSSLLFLVGSGGVGHASQAADDADVKR